MRHRSRFLVAVALALMPVFCVPALAKRRAVSPGPAITKLTAFNDSYSAGQGKALVVSAARGVLKNDRDPQHKPLIALLVTNPLRGTLTFNPDGSFTYTNDGTGASSDSFTYAASNGSERSASATVNITVTAADKITANPETYSLEHGDAISVAAPGVLANDVDPSGASLIALPSAAPVHGTLTLDASGAFVYSHDGSATTSDSFTYRATNGASASALTLVTLTIGADQPPAVANRSYSTVQDTALAVSAPGVLTGATDPDSSSITAVLQSPPAHGTVTLQSNGAFVYTPASGYVGADSFTYLGSDGILTSQSAGTASITVTALPSPSAVDDRYVATTSSLTLSAPGILGNDTLNGGALLSYGANGNEQIGIGNPAVTTQKGQVTVSADGSFVYLTPGGTFAGTDTFKYIVRNAGGSSTATVTITVGSQCSPITITTASLPAGTLGKPYPAVSFAQTGGAAPVSWSSGALPAGLQFSSAGALWGTPSARGSFNITVTVTDARSCFAVKTLPLTVSCPAITIVATNLPTGTAGVTYTDVALSQTGGVGAVTWSLSATSGPLPAGMSLSSAGILGGTPQETGTFPFTALVTDENGCSATRDFSIAVVPSA